LTGVSCPPLRQEKIPLPCPNELTSLMRPFIIIEENFHAVYKRDDKHRKAQRFSYKLIELLPDSEDAAMAIFQMN
jgi:hypothetical protein